MRLRDRYLQYLTILGIVFLLILITFKTAVPADTPKVPKDLCRVAAKYVGKMKKAGLADYWIAPPELNSLDPLVFVEPKLWGPMVHKDKVFLVKMFIAFFLCFQQDHPDRLFLAVHLKNMSTKESLARGWLIDGGEGFPSGTVEVFK